LEQNWTKEQSYISGSQVVLHAEPTYFLCGTDYYYFYFIAGSAVAKDVIAAGYRVLWSTDGVWYLDGLDVTWQSMYNAVSRTRHLNYKL
jgi:hypothetical protein